MDNKTCARCLNEIPVSLFYKSKTHKDGYMSWCKSCVLAYGKKYFLEHKKEASEKRKIYNTKNHDRIMEKQKEYAKNHKQDRVASSTKYKKNHPEYVANWKHRMRLKKYSITQEEFDLLVKVQNNKCAICGDTAPLCVDHDHVTGNVRGLLCRACNYSIGAMKDSPERLRSAASYLENHVFVT